MNLKPRRKHSTPVLCTAAPFMLSCVLLRINIST